MALNYLRQYVKLAPVVDPEASSTEHSRLAVEDLIAGHLIPGEDGACFVSHTTIDADRHHGLHALGALDGLTMTQLALISRDPELAFADLTGAVFLDTETTGLSMGTGTYVFLVGAGYFRAGQFHVKQFFLRSPGEELAFLTALDSFLREFSTLVTFNGKAFDWPLLENRYFRHRSLSGAPLDDPPHVDLLHPARRLWKRRLENCRLQSLERNILGVARTTQDVPGWMIPAMYFSYLRSGDGRDLQGVFYHNLHDILSLAALAIHIDRVFADPMGGLVTHGIDFLCLGKAFDKHGDAGNAILCLEEALKLPLTLEARHETLLRLSQVFKRERRWDQALHVWERSIEEGGECALQALVERAKFHEHVEHEYLDALDDVQRARTLLELFPLLKAGQDLNELEHRQARLLNRVYRNRTWASSGQT